MSLSNYGKVFDMKKEKKISILVTFYNQKNCISQCLNSILMQKGDFNIEILCGDDGSTDGSYETLKMWENRYNCIKVFRMSRDNNMNYEPIERVSANRVNLLKNATGEFVAFLDGDDYFIDEEKFSRQIKLLNKSKNIVCCGHPIKEVWDDGTKNDKVVSYISDKTVVINKFIYWSYIWFHADTMLFKNVFLNKPELIDDIDEKFFDDNLITFYFIQFGSIVYTPECMVAYTQNINSSWNKRSSLQKALINMRVYYSATKINSKFKIPSFIKTYEDWVEIYHNRNKIINFEKGMGDIFSKRFINSSRLFKDMPLINKILYQLKYGIIPLIKPIVYLLRKFKKFTYRKI